MCQPKKCCQKPEQLKGTPQECSPEQVQKCHGTEKDHPCAGGEEAVASPRAGNGCLSRWGHGLIPAATGYRLPRDLNPDGAQFVDRGLGGALRKAGVPEADAWHS